MDYNILNSVALDVIPKYIYNRDILGYDVNLPDMQHLKKKILEHPYVTSVLEQQKANGSWGGFHSMSTSNYKTYTTEMALRRLWNLGLDKDDAPIKKAINHMESFLDGDIELEDYVEKKHDWALLTRLFVATWVLTYDSENSKGLLVARKWANIIEASFRKESFDKTAYLEAYNSNLMPEPNKMIWTIENFYVVSIVKGLLSEKAAKYYARHLLNYDKGLYYIYGNKLTQTPEVFKSKQSMRYLNALYMVTQISTDYQEIKTIKSWLKSQSEDELWDLGKTIRDNMHYPLSSSWRKPVNRSFDSTVYILKLIKLMKSNG
jgi:hypothetical protein